MLQSVALVSSEGKWQKVNRSLCDILGYSEEEFLARNFQSMLFSEDLSNTLLKIHEVLAGKLPTCQMEQRYRHKTKKTVWALWSVSTTGDASSEPPNFIFQIQDITDKNSCEDTAHKASHDTLTNLPIALCLVETRRSSEKNKGTRYRASIFFLDLDRFKLVNDSLDISSAPSSGWNPALLRNAASQRFSGAARRRRLYDSGRGKYIPRSL